MLEENGTLLKQSNDVITKFIKKVEQWNKKKVEEYELGTIYSSAKDRSVLQHSLDKGFILAFDATFRWVKICLTL